MMAAISRPVNVVEFQQVAVLVGVAVAVAIAGAMLIA